MYLEQAGTLQFQTCSAIAFGNHTCQRKTCLLEFVCSIQIFVSPGHESVSSGQESVSFGQESVSSDLQISRKASKLRSPLLHAMFGSDEWEVLILEAVLPDGAGLTKRTSLLAPPPQQGAMDHRVCQCHRGYRLYVCPY